MITKKKQLKYIENKPVVTSGEDGLQYGGGGERQVQPSRSKIGYKIVLYNTGNIANALL